jgi:hypothetical protein
MIEPNACALEVVRILMLFARFITARTGFHPEPVDRVQAQWSEVVRALSGDHSVSTAETADPTADEL